MTDHENETRDRFERWLAEQAKSVNVPPASVPREEMWSVISAAAVPAAAGGKGQGAGGWGRGRGGMGRRWVLPAAIAAALVLGVAIDRFVISHGGTGPAAPVTVATRTAVEAAPVTKADSNSGSAPITAPIEKRAVPDEQRTAPTPREYAQVTPRGSSPRNSSSRSIAPGPNDLYRLATVQMLAQAEVVLTTYRANEDRPADAASMQRVGLWAKDVLSSTRLLMDSPVGSDARMRPLLDDLELVLVQLVRLSGAPLTDVERAAIDRTLREHDLLTRIRTAVPAGTPVPSV